MTAIAHSEQKLAFLAIFTIHTFTFTLLLSYFRFHTFAFTLLLSHFHCHTFRFTLSLSHFHFHTFTFTLSLFHTFTFTLSNYHFLVRSGQMPTAGSHRRLLIPLTLLISWGLLVLYKCPAVSCHPLLLPRSGLTGSWVCLRAALTFFTDTKSTSEVLKDRDSFGLASGGIPFSVSQ